MPQILTIAEAVESDAAIAAPLIGEEPQAEWGKRTQNDRVAVDHVAEPQPRNNEEPSWVIGKDEWERRIQALKAVGRRAWRVIPTIDEIIEARDEGRR